MPLGQTCSACRGRKVRCDGGQPMCGPCSRARRPIECTYTPATAVASTPKGEYLKKGAACVPCRKKKKKCDALRPSCSTCKIAGKDRHCRYDENVERSITDALFFKTQFLEQRLAQYESTVAHYNVGLPVLSPAEVPIASTSTIPDLNNPSLYDNPFYDVPQALNILYERLRTPPIPSPTIDPYGLSGPHPFRGLQEFRETYFKHAWQYGCMLSEEKMEAILVGDLSGTVVHPAITHMSVLLGCRMWQIQRHEFIPDTIENEQLPHIFSALENMDPVTETLVRYILAVYYLLKKQMEDAENQLLMAADVVHRKQLNFPSNPVDLLQLEPNDEQVELISVLSQLIYLDRCSSFFFGAPTRLHKRFDEDLKNLSIEFPLIAKSNVNYLRARSLLLYLRVQDLAAHSASLHSPLSFNPARPQWFDNYWATLEEITMHASTVESEVLKASFGGESARAVALKMCLVVALSGKAQMHWLVHRSHADSAQRALDVVMQVVSVTRTFKDNEFVLLDPLLGVCWSTVAKILVDILKGNSLPVHNEIPWRPALQTIDVSAKKLGYDIPFMDESVRDISEVLRVVEVT